jgi:hypothetical protein
MSDGDLPIATYVAAEPDIAFISSTAAFDSASSDPTDDLLPPALDPKAPRMATDSIDVQALYIQGVALTQQSVAQLQLQVNTLNTTTQTHTGEIDTLGQQLSNLDGEITSLDTNLATMTANLGLTDGNVTALEGRMDTAELNVTDLEAELLLKQNLSEKNQANGYAGLDSAAKLPLTSLTTAAPGITGVWSGNTVAPSSSEMAVMVLDTADNRLKPLNPEVLPTYWNQQGVANGLGDLYANKTDNTVTAALDTRVTTNTTNITANTTAIATINSTSLPAKQDISQREQNNGYAGLGATGLITATRMPLCTTLSRGASALTTSCRLFINGADFAPGSNTGTINAWYVATDTAYLFNTLYGAGPKASTGKTFFKAPRDGMFAVKCNLAFSITTATNNKFFTLRITPVDSARTTAPLQYNYGLINGTTGSQYCGFAVDIPLRTGDSLSLEWNLGTPPIFQKDYTYLHITEAGNGTSSVDWFP